jgi:hypothetical protein
LLKQHLELHFAPRAAGLDVGQHALQVAHTLRQGNGQDYSVSSYGPSRFYADGPTFVYTAAVRDPLSRQGAALGGIAIVWDATGQMQSILGDCAAGLDAQDLLAFVDASGQVLHASGPDGLRQHLPALRTAQTGQPVIDLQGQLYGLGDAPGRGYREFGSSDHGPVMAVLEGPVFDAAKIAPL